MKKKIICIAAVILVAALGVVLFLFRPAKEQGPVELRVLTEQTTTDGMNNIANTLAERFPPSIPM